ncbi:MAG: hypothetical protein V1926_04185 [Candidatus Peregrinibacteria bacterium]
MQHICRNAWCRQSFEITDDDLKFYEKVSPVLNGKKELIPPPTLCPSCRSHRRYTYRNERHLYRRPCSASGRNIMALYAPEKPFPVYEPSIWHSDGWDPKSFGRAFDFSRPFFNQYGDLQRVVPRIALAAVNNENCDYVNQVWYSKNCYLCTDASFCEDALYCYATYHSKNVVDCAHTRESELSCDLTDCVRCYGCTALLDCKDCHDTFFSVDCVQCSCAAFCWNLRGKQYHIFNKPVSREEWEKFVQSFRSGSAAKRAEDGRIFESILTKAVRRANHNIQCEDCLGDYLLHSRRCDTCFDGDQSEDLKYCCRMDQHVKSAMDIDQSSDLEVGYESLSVGGHDILFSTASWSVSNANLLYCDLILNSSDCFGCVCMKNGKYCILNKQFTKEEYEELVPRIIEHMRRTGEWGEFFPAKYSPFCYNESMAQIYFFPLSKEEVLRRGWQWRDQKDEMPKVDRIIPATQLPDSIDDIPDDILNWAIECETTKRPFKVIKQELDFYRKMRLSVPHFHPDERHRRRMALRNPRKLWDRECAKCHKPISTSYAPERPETVYCEECYLKEVY